MTHSDGHGSSHATNRPDQLTEPEQASEGDLDRAVERFYDWADREEVGGSIGLPDPQWTDLLGVELGEFRVVGELGRGGMGVVLSAVSLQDESRRVAIKVLDDVMPSKKTLIRFRRESKALARLDHPNLVPLVGVGASGRVPFTVMEFVEGVALSELLVSLSRLDERPLRAREVAESVPGASTIEHDSGFKGSYVNWVLGLGVALAQGLAHAHDSGVIHRDIKPANIMLTPKGVPVIVDFGLAVGEGDETLTATGAFLGTLPYSAPEQIDGARVDARSDIYSLGVTLYELLAVARPFVAAGRKELLAEIETGTGPAPVEGVSRDLLTVLRTAMHFEPEQRYQDTAAFGRDLLACAEGRAIEARPPSWTRRALTFCKHHPLVVTSVLIVAAAFGGQFAHDRWRAELRVEAASQHLESARAAAVELIRFEAELAALHDPTGLRVLNTRDEVSVVELQKARREQRELFDENLDQAESSLFLAVGFVGGRGVGERTMGGVLRLRIERALVEHLDVLDRKHFSTLVQRLVDLAPTEALLAGLDDVSPLGLVSEPPGASFEISAALDARVVASGRTPAQVSDLEPGSYVVQLSHPGRTDVTVPVVVRARAAALVAGLEQDPIPLWSRVDVRLPEAGSVPPGWSYVATGASLVGGQRPRWLWLDDFWIQTYEVTMANILDCLNDERAPAVIGETLPLPTNTMLKPRFADNVERLEVRITESGEWVAGAEVKDIQWPARGLSQQDADAYANYVQSVVGPQPEGWYVALPDDAEWERAARGADGRLFPWGNEYALGQCVDARMDLDGDPEPWPSPVGSGPGDVSVFGVHDLAGSVSERIGSAFETRRQAFTARGGSYRDRDIARLSTLARRDIGDRPEVDIGFRLVMRREPAWLSTVEHPVRWSDDFERPDGDTVGGGWIECRNLPMAPVPDPGSPEDCSLSAGRMVCVGGVGNYSNHAHAFHGVGGEGRAFVLRALLEIDTLRPPAVRSASLRVMPQPMHAAPWLGVDIKSDGYMQLSMKPHVLPYQLPSDMIGEIWVELSSNGQAASLRVWSKAGQRPDDAVVELPLHPDFEHPGYVSVDASGWCGVRVQVEEISFDGAP